MPFYINIGDLVWAKFGRYPPWPAMIVEPTYQIEKPVSRGQIYFYVFFFETEICAWVEENCIYPYAPYKMTFTSISCSARFKRAVEKIELCFKENIEGDSEKSKSISDVDIEKVDLTNDSEESILLTENKKSAKRKKSIAISDQESSITSKRRKKQKTKKETFIQVPDSQRSPSESSVSLNRTSINLTEKPKTPIPEMKKPNFVCIPEEERGPPWVISEDRLLEQSEHYKQSLLRKTEIIPTTSNIGFIGLGKIGYEIVLNLISSGHKINIFCRNPNEYEPIKQYADRFFPKVSTQFCSTAYDVIKKSDIIFSCITNPRSISKNKNGLYEIIEEKTFDKGFRNKGYVEMTLVDPKTSREISEIVKRCGGRYLETQTQGSKIEAEKGDLVLIASGDTTLFVDCMSCFKAMAGTVFFLGQVELATRMHLILEMIRGVMLVGLAESLTLANNWGISSKDLLQIFQATCVLGPYLSSKAGMMTSEEWPVEQTIQELQEEMDMSVRMSEELQHPLLLATVANELYKHCWKIGYNNYDVCCVYNRSVAGY